MGSTGWRGRATSCRMGILCTSWLQPNAAVAATKEIKAREAFCCQNGVAQAPFRVLGFSNAVAIRADTRNSKRSWRVHIAWPDQEVAGLMFCPQGPTVATFHRFVPSLT